MSRRSRSKKREICFDEAPIMKVKKNIKTKSFDPGKKLRNPNFVAKLFFQSLLENDIEAALDVLEGYILATGKADIAKQGKIAPSTVYHALSKGSNPTLKTVAKLLHASAH